MLSKKLPFCIDHFSLAGTHRDKPIQLLMGLGFTTADTYKDRTVHWIFDNSYFELCTYIEGGTATWLSQQVKTTNLPRVHSYRLSVKGSDPNPMHDALKAAFPENVGDINNPFRQEVRYSDGGWNLAGYQTFFVSNFEPFTDILFGATTHLTKELIVKNPNKYPHINGAKRLAYITAYCDSQERFDEAEKAITALYNAAKDATDVGYNLDTYQLVDKEAYIDEFGCEPREGVSKLPIVAVAFEGANQEFVKRRAYDMNIAYFEKDGKLYVDCRRTLGWFLIFLPEEK
ncbi:MAG: hypothetical protein MJ171_06785 [Clostridia bacterium]|nr:hypothetical protein [Clostridia bacterium]